MFSTSTRESLPSPMPIIVGVPRSGTTLLRLMLDAHPELAIPPETGFLGLAFDARVDLRQDFFAQVTNYPPDAPGWQDYGISREEFWEQLTAIEPFDLSAGLRCFYRMYACRFGTQKWGDKTPGHSYAMPVIEQRLPEAHFIHIIRDGRDVALSWRPLWFSPGQDIATLAQHWANWIRITRAHGEDCKHYCEVRFEALVSNPTVELHRICAFLALEFKPQMVTFFERSPDRLAEHKARVASDGRIIVSHEQRLQQQSLTRFPVRRQRAEHWRQIMSPIERSEFANVAGSCLQELGYEV